MISNLQVKANPETFIPRCHTNNRPPSRQSSRRPCCNKNGSSKGVEEKCKNPLKCSVVDPCEYNEKHDCAFVCWPKYELSPGTFSYASELYRSRKNDNCSHHTKENNKSRRSVTAHDQGREQRLNCVPDNFYAETRPRSYCSERCKPVCENHKHKKPEQKCDNHKKREYFWCPEVQNPCVATSHTYDANDQPKCHAIPKQNPICTYEPNTQGDEVICIYPPDKKEKLCKPQEVNCSNKIYTNICTPAKQQMTNDGRIICDGLKHVKSVSVIASVVYRGCRCEKRNGLQDYCPNYFCSQNPECIAHDSSHK